MDSVVGFLKSATRGEDKGKAFQKDQQEDGPYGCRAVTRVSSVV